MLWIKKKEFVLASLKENVNFTKLCARYCITTKTGYKWKERFLQLGFEGIKDLSTKPKSNPNQISEEMILEIVKLKVKKNTGEAEKSGNFMSTIIQENIFLLPEQFTGYLNRQGLLLHAKDTETHPVSE